MSSGAITAKCYRCGERKPIEEFAWRRKARGQHDTFCRPCRSAYGKEHYAANRERYIEQARVQKQRLMLERTTYLLDSSEPTHAWSAENRIPSFSSSTTYATSRSRLVPR